MPLTTAALFFARATHRLSAPEYVEWAASKLDRDFDSPSLRILAGLDGGSVSEAEDYFSRALQELGIAEPDLDAIIREYACELCRGIVGGKLETRRAVGILNQICIASKYQQDFRVWIQLDYALANLEKGDYPHALLTTGNFEETVRAEARRFLDSFCDKSYT